MTPSQRLAAAERQVEAARARLAETVQALADELEPKKLMRELWEGAKVKGADLAEEAVDAVKSRPIAATGIAAAIGLFLAREPIIEATGRFLDGREAKKTEKKRRKAAAKAPAGKQRQVKTPPAETKSTEKSDERSE